MARHNDDRKQEAAINLENWVPKTLLGKNVKNKTESSMNDILKRGENVLEAEIIDTLLPNNTSDLIAVGQSKGKFGGGKRSTWKQTQKKTMEGNKPKFTALAIVGNQDGFIGLGRGKAKETVPAREKATRNAKLHLISIRRGCGSWKCGCGESHSIPFKVEGKSGSLRIELKPAPKGTGLIIEKECAKVLRLAGIKDVYSKTQGATKTKLNLVQACFDALSALPKVKMSNSYVKKAGVITGNDHQ